jgi:tetratricopeptide (TPR) repeat protein
VATALLAAGDRAGALAAIDEALALDATLPDGCAEQAQLLLEDGRFDDVVAAHARAVEAGVQLAALEVTAGKALLELARDDEAGERFARAVALDADLPDAWAGYALVHVRAQRAAEGRAALERLVALDAGHALAPSLRAALRSLEGGE